jgi:alkanesulfonate monooxygenase SsuD/methylene tetrahydromethanopterin reductase-like flavin-dependent oxidoreductase (luciferase family)
MMSDVDVGYGLPQFDWDGPVAWATVVDAARRAEGLGFASVWLADHLFLDPSRYGRPSGRAAGYDPLIGLAAVARATARVKLGILVVCTQLRPPTVLAKMLATLDRVAQGRVITGIGAGWFEPEFAEAGVPFLSPRQRVSQVSDAVQILKGMWRGEVFNFDGDYYSARDARCRPGPAGPNTPQLWVGGKGDRMMEIAVRHADGFNHQGWTDDAGPRRFDAFRATCERLGRDPSTMALSACHAINDFGALGDHLGRFETEGVTSVILSVGQVPFGVRNLDAIEAVAAALP